MPLNNREEAVPQRKNPLSNRFFYHILNRSVEKISIFRNRADYTRTIQLLDYYRFDGLPCSFSNLQKWGKTKIDESLRDLRKREDKLVEFICFCLMPNHFHFLLRQMKNDGITTFLRNMQNSYAKYFNKKYDRQGTLFQGPFKAVLIENDSQLLHLSRYIHLNPYSSQFVGSKEELLSYPWSSISEHLGIKEGLCKTSVILDHFSNKSKYVDFLLDRADYQRTLEELKYDKLLL